MKRKWVTLWGGARGWSNWEGRGGEGKGGEGRGGEGVVWCGIEGLNTFPVLRKHSELMKDRMTE